MKSILLTSCLLGVYMFTVSIEGACQDVGSFMGAWVDDGSAAGLVKSKCSGLNRGTDSWRKRTKVKDSCSSVSRNTPIASFVGKKYRGYAAIFVRCGREGIHVYDQAPHRPLGLRFIPWGGTVANHNAENFFTIH